MSDSNSNSRGGGTGFFGLLTVLFIGLKLTGYIAWSWFWVLSPLLGPMVIIMTAVGLYGIVCAIEEATKK